MIEPSISPERLFPQDGDVVVTREVHSRVHYTVRQLPGIVQFSAGVRDEALRLARIFGRTHDIDVWYCDQGTYRLLGSYRPRTSPQTSVHHAADGSAKT